MTNYFCGAHQKFTSRTIAYDLVDEIEQKLFVRM